MDAHHWSDDAACKGVDQAYFFRDQEPKDGGKLGSYKQICGNCPVKNLCLDFALLYNMKGVWGGMSEKARNRVYPYEVRQALIADAIESGVYISEFAKIA